MKRAIVLLISVAAVVAGCGSAAGAGQGSGSTSAGSTVSATSAAAVLAAARASAKHATAVAFDATLGVKVGGNLKGAGMGAAILKGPLKFEFKGHAGLAGADKSKFDITFAFNYLGGSFTGRALSPNGKVLYLQLPALMGPGWKSLSLKGVTHTGSPGPGTSGGLATLKAEGLDPSKLLKNLTMTTADGQDTISADVDVAAVFAAIAKVEKGQGAIPAKAQGMIAQLEKAVTKAHGSLSFSSATHLPTNDQMQFAMTIPPSLSRSASGIKSIALNLDVRFSDWNKSFSVVAPKGATPLNTAGLFGVHLSSAA